MLSIMMMGLLYHPLTTQICEISHDEDVLEEIINSELESLYFDSESGLCGVIEDTKEEPKMTYAGKYELTAYVATGSPCADGVYPQVGYTAASNDKKLWHRWIYIEGYGDVYIHDTGGMANNVIDIYMGSYTEAVQFGRKKDREVYVYD